MLFERPFTNELETCIVIMNTLALNTVLACDLQRVSILIIEVLRGPTPVRGDESKAHAHGFNVWPAPALPSGGQYTYV
jgi:hypothetical protein